jgi:hypothetical protein
MTGYFGPVGSNTASILMRQAPFIIGDLVLEGHEVPARISIGGAQVVAIHKMPGGTRIIDAMGADSSAITWRGIFIGPGAAQRARALDLMRQQGMPRILSFGDYTLDIVIVNYSYDYQDQGAVISYRIRGEIVPARSKTVGSASTIGSLVQDDLLTAQDVLQIGATAASAYASLAVSGNETSASALAMTSLATSLAATSAAAASASLDTASGSAPVQSNLEAIAVALSEYLLPQQPEYRSLPHRNSPF